MRLSISCVASEKPFCMLLAEAYKCEDAFFLYFRCAVFKEQVFYISGSLALCRGNYIRHLTSDFGYGGDERIRTADPLLARQVLSQLSYIPTIIMVGLGGLEPPTSRLSGVRSNLLSYRPIP